MTSSPTKLVFKFNQQKYEDFLRNKKAQAWISGPVEVEIKYNHLHDTHPIMHGGSLRLQSRTACAIREGSLRPRSRTFSYGDRKMSNMKDIGVVEEDLSRKLAVQRWSNWQNFHTEVNHNLHLIPQKQRIQPSTRRSSQVCYSAWKQPKSSVIRRSVDFGPFTPVSLLKSKQGNGVQFHTSITDGLSQNRFGPLKDFIEEIPSYDSQNHQRKSWGPRLAKFKDGIPHPHFLSRRKMPLGLRPNHKVSGETQRLNKVAYQHSHAEQVKFSLNGIPRQRFTKEEKQKWKVGEKNLQTSEPFWSQQRRPVRNPNPWVSQKWFQKEDEYFPMTVNVIGKGKIKTSSEGSASPRWQVYTRRRQSLMKTNNTGITSIQAEPSDTSSEYDEMIELENSLRITPENQEKMGVNMVNVEESQSEAEV